MNMAQTHARTNRILIKDSFATTTFGLMSVISLPIDHRIANDEPELPTTSSPGDILTRPDADKDEALFHTHGYYKPTEPTKLKPRRYKLAIDGKDIDHIRQTRCGRALRPGRSRRLACSASCC